MAKEKLTLKKESNPEELVMTRKMALKKAGLVTLSAASMILLLKTPAKASGSSPAPLPGW